MVRRVETHPLEAAHAALLNLRTRRRRGGVAHPGQRGQQDRAARRLNAQPYERGGERSGHANGFKPKTVLTRLKRNHLRGSASA